MPVKIHLGDFPVVQVSQLGGIVIAIGKGIHNHSHLGDFPHDVKPGDKLPLYTEIPYALPRRPSE